MSIIHTVYVTHALLLHDKHLDSIMTLYRPDITLFLVEWRSEVVIEMHW